MRFAHPYFLLLLLLLPVWIRYYRKREKNTKSWVRYSSVRLTGMIAPAPAVRLRRLPFYFRIIGAALLIVALARPQSGEGFQEIKRHGIDIMLALDISTSMDVMDLAPTRLEAAKSAVLKFIKNRSNDRIGLVVFAGTSFTRCPLTLDYDVLKSFIKPLKSGLVQDGTAIGMAIANGVNRLMASKAKSKIIILLTDGVNNRGLIDPETATELAVAKKIKVYTIGVGKPGIYFQDVDDPRFGKRKVPVRSEIDEKLLRKIARRTGAHYYAARNEQELVKIYEEIDSLEKSDVKSRFYFKYTEWFEPFAWLALIVLGGEALLSKTVIRRLPE
jgi:Ca-activated chloride channel family protein